MKVFTSFLGSTRKRRANALPAIVTHDAASGEPASSPTDSAIIHAFPAPPSNNLSPNAAAAAATITHRTQYVSSEEYIQPLTSSSPASDTTADSLGQGSMDSPSFVPASPFIHKKLSTPRSQMPINGVQGRQPKHEFFESPRSAPTPPVPTTTPPTPGNMIHQFGSSDAASQLSSLPRPPATLSRSSSRNTAAYSVAPTGESDPTSISNHSSPATISISDPPQVRCKRSFLIALALP